MLAADENERKTCEWADWKGWLALGWMTVFGVLYCVMMIREKAPTLISILRLKD